MKANCCTYGSYTNLFFQNQRFGVREKTQTDTEREKALLLEKQRSRKRERDKRQREAKKCCGCQRTQRALVVTHGDASTIFGFEVKVLFGIFCIDNQRSINTGFLKTRVPKVWKHKCLKLGLFNFGCL